MRILTRSRRLRLDRRGCTVRATRAEDTPTGPYQGIVTPSTALMLPSRV